MTMQVKHCDCHAVERPQYIQWLRREVVPLHYDTDWDVVMQRWPQDAATLSDSTVLDTRAPHTQAADAMRFGAASDNLTVVLMTQSTPDRCAIVAAVTHALRTCSLCILLPCKAGDMHMCVVELCHTGPEL